MSHKWESFGFRFDSVPTANQICIAFDSTRGGINMTWAPVAAGSAFLVPGPWRGRYAPAIVRYSIRCATNDVTLAEQVLTGNANAAADWETQGALGAATITAGTTAMREFKPLTVDWMIKITAGAGAPTAFCVWGDVIHSTSYGG